MLAPSASIIVGCTIGMIVTGLVSAMTPAFAPFGMTARTVVAACFIALGAGVILPRNLILWLSAVAQRRVVGSDEPDERTGWFVPDTAPDRPLHWSVLSIVGLAVGLSAALLPVSIRVAEGVMRILFDGFVWSTVPLAFLDLAVACAVVAIPLGLLGISLSAVHHLSCRRSRWEPAATTWLLGGAGAGVVLSALVSRLGANPIIPILAAALPAFGLSICCMSFASMDRAPHDASPSGKANDALPLSCDQYPRLTRFSVVAVGSGAACAIYVWFLALPERSAFDAVYIACSLAAMGIGVGLGSHAGRSAVRFISSFGLTCAGAGALVAAAAVPIESEASHVTMIPAYISLGAIGYAMATGRALLMHRVGSRSSEGPRMTARLLYGTAITCWLTAPAAVGAFGTQATLVMLALSLLALGGILIVHDPAVSQHARRIRLAFVFGAVGIMIAIGSSGANPWRRPVRTTIPALGAQVVSREPEHH